MTINQLSYLITIAETGSLNKAAELLYISQPSLSGAVQELEKELGIIIFRRTGRAAVWPVRGNFRKVREKRKAEKEVRRFDPALFLCRKGLCGDGKGF